MAWRRSYRLSTRHDTRLDGEVYLASSKPVLGALEVAAARHVTVRINLEQHPYGTGSAAPQLVYRTLAAHGVQMRWTSSSYRFTHAKYLVVDAIRAWIGTPNWTTSAFTGNREFAVIDTDPVVARETEAVFTADWDRKVYTGADDALVLSPANARTQIEALIASARSSLDVYAEELNDQVVSQDLTQAVHRGVKVRLVTTVDDKIGSLAGVIPVVRRSKSLYIHAKIIIADGRAMYLGSENYSATSLDKNREMGLIVRDPAIIQRVAVTFAHDVAGTVPPVTHTALPGPAATKTMSPGTTLSVSVQVAPNPIPYGSYPTVTIHTAPAALCGISVLYTSGKGPTSYPDHSATANAAGVITEQGQWHMQSKSAGGTVSASCSGKAATARGTFSFQIG
jgi:cardiolipin synthase